MPPITISFAVLELPFVEISRFEDAASPTLSATSPPIPFVITAVFGVHFTTPTICFVRSLVYFSFVSIVRLILHSGTNGLTNDSFRDRWSWLVLESP
jgi:hypothetical protein